jgi:hypothetical protein
MRYDKRKPEPIRSPVMKKLVAVALLFLVCGAGPLFSQERPKQEVTVTAVEVPVRVLRKGVPVKGLTKEDFEVTENGIPQTLTAFEVVSRRIAESAESAPSPKPRVFILIFNVFDYNDGVGEAIDYFFRDVFRPHDQLVILTEDRVLDIRKDKDPGKVAAHLKESLKAYKSLSTFAIVRAYSELGMEGEKLLMSLKGIDRSDAGGWDQGIVRFYDNYQRIWNEYKRQFFGLDMKLYENIIRRARNLEGEKWAICFEQRELFPKLKHEGPLEYEIRKITDSMIDPQDQVKVRTIQAKQTQLRISMDVARDFPGERLRDLFMQAGITFHLLLMKSFRTLLTPDFELTEVAQDYEDCFRRISNSTGGVSAFSNNVMDTLKEASAKEDYHYLLVYNSKAVPASAERTIGVKVRQEGVEVISLKRYVAEERPLITIADFSAGRQSIRFVLKNYARAESGGKARGAADVRIVLYDSKSDQAFSGGKTMELVKNEITVSLNFNNLKPGTYFIIIEAYDKISGAKDVLSRSIEL